MTRARRESRWDLESEPWPDGSERVHCGGEAIVPAGFTSGGLPYGLTLEELRESMGAAERGRGWARARRAMELAVVSLELTRPSVGRVRKVGEGLSRSAFAAEIDARDEGWPRVLVALVSGGGPCAREIRDVEREARLLGFLARQDLPFRVPDLAVAVRDGDEAILVCEHVAGLPVDLRAGRMGSVVPWELVAEVAASVHAVSVAELDWLGGTATRREHGEELVARLAPLEDAPDPEAREALRWLRANPPPREPARLVHGDLLGQNLLFYPDRAMVVLDWEHATLGDPAYDLAIVTRGVRRPFQVEGGLEKLVDAYAEHSPTALTERDVRFHEIALHLRWYARAIAGEPDAEPAPAVLARLRNQLRAVGARS